MLGNTTDDDDLRSTYWTAIRSIGSTFEDFPKARRGRESALPDEVEMNAVSVKNQVIAAFAGITNADLITTVILPHGRTGGAFEDINDLARNMGKKAYDALVKGYKEGRWDGSMNGEIPAMTPPAVKTAEGEVKRRNDAKFIPRSPIPAVTLNWQSQPYGVALSNPKLLRQQSVLSCQEKQYS